MNVNKELELLKRRFAVRIQAAALGNIEPGFPAVRLRRWSETPRWTCSHPTALEAQLETDPVCLEFPAS